jgi:hypothetical protein
VSDLIHHRAEVDSETGHVAFVFVAGERYLKGAALSVGEYRYLLKTFEVLAGVELPGAGVVA